MADEPKPIRELIIEAVRDAMATIPSVQRAGREPNVEIARDGLPEIYPGEDAISIEDRGDKFLGYDGNAERQQMELDLLADCTGDGSAGLSRAYQLLVARIRKTASEGAQWGGLALLTELGDLDIEIVNDADPRTAVCAQAVRIQYATRRGDPFTAAN